MDCFAANTLVEREGDAASTAREPPLIHVAIARLGALRLLQDLRREFVGDQPEVEPDDIITAAA